MCAYSLQAWEYFLMRPAVIISCTTQTNSHRKHVQAIHNLKQAVQDIIGQVWNDSAKQLHSNLFAVVNGNEQAYMFQRGAASLHIKANKLLSHTFL